MLCVDDEPAVLSALARQLRHRFRIVTAASGSDGLKAIAAADEPFEVVVSDMMMPGMNGAEFLRRVHLDAPFTQRVLLTGASDTRSAASAVNEGKISCFLCKPCDDRELVDALQECSRVYRMTVAEADLLDKTLRGAVHALVDTLALADPVAFARVTRVRRIVAELIEAITPAEAWAIDMAAILGQLGALALPHSVNEKLHDGAFLTAEEQRAVDDVPSLSLKLIESVPRLELVCDIIRTQRRDTPPVQRGESPADVGAALLGLAFEMDAAEARGLSRNEAVAVLAHKGSHDETHLAALTPDDECPAPRAYEIALHALRPGMVLVQDLRDPAGLLLVGRGHVVSDGMIARLLDRCSRMGTTPMVVVEGPADSRH
ncbi:MAG: response regulator [Actinomycetota bacterium]